MSKPDGGAPTPTDTDLEGLAIGEQIRDLRKAKRMTINELASRIDRSIGYVSQIERGLSAVTINVLQQIAGALDVQISWFFQGNANAPKEERDLIVRRANRRRLRFGGSGVTEELLSPNLSGQIELILTRFEPGGRTGDGAVGRRPHARRIVCVEGLRCEHRGGRRHHPSRQLGLHRERRHLLPRDRPAEVGGKLRRRGRIAAGVGGGDARRPVAAAPRPFRAPRP